MKAYTVIWTYWTGSNGDAGFDDGNQAEAYFWQRVDDAKTERIRSVELLSNANPDDPKTIQSFEDA